MPGILGSLYGGLGFGGEAKKIYGSKPVIPQMPTLEQAQQSAIKTNIATLPQAQQLASSTNAFNQEQLTSMLEKAFPGAKSKIEGVINSFLAGEIPRDVSDAVRRATASQAVAGGYGGSGFAQNLTARDLGLTSLQITQQGLNSAEQWLSMATAPTFDVTSMFVTPQQKYADLGNQFSRDLLASKVKAAPDPVARGAFDTTMSIIGMVLSAYGGGPGYQGTQQPLSNTVQGGSMQGPPQPNSFYMGGGGYGFGKQQGGGWFMGAGPGPG